MSDAGLMKRRQAGHVLFGQEDDGRLAAYGWVSGAGCTVGILHDMTFKVPARSIYIWDCYTAPEARNRGRFQALLGGILDSYPDIDTAFVAVDVGNKPSRRALEKTGFRPLFRYCGLRLFRRPVMGIARLGGGIVRTQSAFDRLTSGAGREII